MKTWDELRAKVHEEFKYASAYRMGIASVMNGYRGQAVYAPGSPGSRLYLQGIAEGRKRMLAKKEQQP